MVVVELGERKIQKLNQRGDYNRVQGTQLHVRNFGVQTCKVTYGGVDGAYYTSTRTRRMGSDGVCSFLWEVFSGTSCFYSFCCLFRRCLRRARRRIEQPVKQHIGSPEEFMIRCDYSVIDVIFSLKICKTCVRIQLIYWCIEKEKRSRERDSSMLFCA